ncbi:MAG: ATP-binding protein [Candidatus Zixiibacteriota bacterium]
MARYEYQYRSVLASEEAMLDDLGLALSIPGIPIAIKQGFTLAVCEAFTNALLHGNQSDPSKLINVVLEVNETGIRADITDEGTGGLSRIANRKDRGLLAEGGRGIALIEHYADNVTFEENAAGGLKVTIRVSITKTQKTHA